MLTKPRFLLSLSKKKLDFFTTAKITIMMTMIKIIVITMLTIIIITSILKSPVVPVIWLALIGAIYSQIAPFFALNRIFFPANEEVTLKTKQPIRFQGLFKVTNQIAGKWKTKSIIWQILQLSFPKLLFLPPKNGWI